MKHIENCHHMAQMAGIAYLDSKEAKEEYKKLGYTDHKFFDKEGAQCHVVWTRDVYVLCFRGTEPDEFSDILADLNAIPDRAELDGYVHDGFQDELEKVWKDIQIHMETNLKDRTFYICGHSLGGAMATVCASRLVGEVDALFTYGSPRVGSSAFVDALQVLHYRHVNNNDIVPCVPPYPLYCHHGTLRYINRKGKIVPMTRWERFKDKVLGRVDSWMGGKPFDGVSDHSMNKYIEYTSGSDNINV